MESWLVRASPALAPIDRSMSAGLGAWAAILELWSGYLGPRGRRRSAIWATKNPAVRPG
jgi:hypothetical protein